MTTRTVIHSDESKSMKLWVLNYLVAIEQFKAKEDDKLESTKSNLISRKKHRLELLKNAIDDDTGLLVLTKTL